MPQIIFDHVTCQFKNEVKGLNDLNFSVEAGEFLFLVGPSGAGKTTILRLMLREYLPTTGTITIDGEEISKKRGVSKENLRRKIGTSFQDVKLLDDRTVEENISIAMEIIGQKSEEIKKSVDEVLELVNLSDKKNLFPSQLSGGEIQRIGVARAVVGNPLIVFADEPTANLDSEASWKIISLLKEINRSGKTVIVATHNRDLYDSMGERIITLDKGKLVSDEKGEK